MRFLFWRDTANMRTQNHNRPYAVCGPGILRAREV
jgi:hypothetical protein